MTKNGCNIASLSFLAIFNYLFYQTASLGLIYRGYMKGDECFTAFNLTANRQPLTFKLPGVQPYAKFSWIDDREVLVRLNLDGVYIDLTNETANRTTAF